MKNLSLASLGAVVLAGVLSAQSYHDAVYLVGGYGPSTSTLYNQGIFLLDARTASPKMTQLVRPGYFSRFCMDANNRDVLIGVQGTTSTSTLYAGFKSGLFRYDPQGQTLRTLYVYSGNPANGYYAFYHTVIDFNGDYICGVYVYDRQNRQNTGYRIWKIDQGGTLTTLLSTAMLGRPGYFYSRLLRNIDTGKVLICDNRYQTTPTILRYPVIEIDSVTGKWRYWSTGGNYGWYGYYSAPQNHGNGFLEGPYSRYVYRLRPGTTGRTTLATLNGLPYPLYGGGKFDLQTAARLRQVHCAYSFSGSVRTYLYTLDASRSWAVTSMAVSSRRTYSYGFDFYRGRHTQSVSVGPNRWAILLSAPRFPGYAYAVAAGISGVRPGVPLPDGRRINLNLDDATKITLNNLLPAIWNPGRGMLDARGTAIATLDLTLAGQLGIPLWIAWVVLDPKAPIGIAYVPDTYVMRV